MKEMAILIGLTPCAIVKTSYKSITSLIEFDFALHLNGTEAETVGVILIINQIEVG